MQPAADAGAKKISIVLHKPEVAFFLSGPPPPPDLDLRMLVHAPDDSQQAPRQSGLGREEPQARPSDNMFKAPDRSPLPASRTRLLEPSPGPTRSGNGTPLVRSRGGSRVDTPDSNPLSLDRVSFSIPNTVTLQDSTHQLDLLGRRYSVDMDLDSNF